MFSLFFLNMCFILVIYLILIDNIIFFFGNADRLQVLFCWQPIVMENIYFVYFANLSNMQFLFSFVDRPPVCGCSSGTNELLRLTVDRNTDLQLNFIICIINRDCFLQQPSISIFSVTLLFDAADSVIM